MSSDLKILFASSDSIALATLVELNKHFNVVGVLTSPVQQNGRKKVENVILNYCIDNSINYITPEHLKADEREWVSGSGANFLLSFSYSKIFGPKFLSLFQKGTMNIHPSLLPKYRGPSPLQQALLNGDTKSAVSFQTIALSMDEGDIYRAVEFDIPPSFALEELREKVSLISRDNIVSVLSNDLLSPEPQKGCASYTRLISSQQGRVSWQEDGADVIYNKIRAYTPWPRVWCLWDGKKLFLDKVLVLATKSSYPAGSVVAYDKSSKSFIVSTCTFDISITALTIEGKKPQQAADFKNGHSTFVPSKLN